MTPKTCSKESGAKLQALGVRVESAFRWKEAKEEYALMGSKVDLVYGFGVHPKYLHQYIFAPAYLSGELGEMLPEYEITKDKHGWFIRLGKYMMHYSKFIYENLANALSDFVGRCIEEGHVTVEEINRSVSER